MATSPTTPPTASVLLTTDMATLSRAAGSSRRSTLIDSGNSPYEAPCRIRPTSSSGRDVVTIASSVPTATATRMPRITGRSPRRSPSRPSTGVSTAAASRFAVSTQPAAPAETSQLLAR